MKIDLEKLPIPNSIAKEIHAYTGAIKTIKPIGGGCIANAIGIEADQGAFFLKWGRGEVSNTFEPESVGLNTLSRAGSALTIPRVIDQGGSSSRYLLLEWVESGYARDFTWEFFGREMAQLHRYTGKAYGYSIDNFIGRLPQTNNWETSWPAFFRSQRLEPQVALARASEYWQREWDPMLELLYHRVDNLLPDSPERSIVHGDLWSGNYMITAQGFIALIDPATYYGHRETDLAMTELFGGFEPSFYDAYTEAWPLEAGYEDRKEIYNLYHLINHLNHFGLSYARGVERILKMYGQ